MDSRDVRTGIRRSWQIIETLELGETFSSSNPLRVNDEFRDLALSNETDYASIYLTGLRLSHYNFLVVDYSYFQFTWSSENHVRYAFYPNPFTAGLDGGIEAFRQLRAEVSAGLLTQEEYLERLQEVGPELRVPPIRYENAPSQHRGVHHPCSHFHIGHHDDNRWAIRRTLTPLAFTLLILKHYYGAFWRESDDEIDMAGNRLESRLIEERTNCRIIGDALFSDLEARTFFFS